MRDDDVTVDGLGTDEVNEILQSESICPCANDPRARHAKWCRASDVERRRELRRRELGPTVIEYMGVDL